MESEGLRLALGDTDKHKKSFHWKSTSSEIQFEMFSM